MLQSNLKLTLQSNSRCFDGEQRYYTHESTATNSTMTFSIYLPDEAVAGHECPAILYLSGLTCNADNVTQKAHFQQRCSEMGIIFIAPDTSPRSNEENADSNNDSNDDNNNDSKNKNVPDDERFYVGQGASYYVDAKCEPWATYFNMQTYIIEEFYTLIHNEFPISSIGLTGHSMGGHGALMLGFKYPDQFISVSAISPVCVASESEWGKAAFIEYFGEDSQKDWKKNDATYSIEQAGKQYDSILVDQGDADEFYQQGHLKPERLLASCKQVEQPLSLRYHANYDHSYYFIQTVIDDHIEYHYKSALIYK